MYVTVVPNRNSPPAVLLRESFREAGKVRNRTLANLTKWPADKVATLRLLLKGEKLVPVEHACDVVRTFPHGHVAAVRGTLRRLGVHTMLGVRRSRRRDIVEAMLVARIIGPQSKLATCRGLDAATADSSLGHDLGLGDVDVHEMYDALDWLSTRQSAVEKRLADAHLERGGLALYDLTATHFEGRTCPLAKLGYPRGSKKGKLQVNFGLLCDRDGRPVSVQVFDGNMADPGTVGDQVAKVRDEFGLDTVVFVGDRGMLTAARIREDLQPNGMGWITSMRAPQIRKLADGGAFQMSLFDDTDLAEITHPGFPGERLIVCRNPLLAAERSRKRTDLLDDTEHRLEKIRAATKRPNRPLRGKASIALRVGRVLGRSKMGKHFCLDIEDDSFSFERDEERIRREADLDGIYVIRSNVSADRIDSEGIIAAYKDLQRVERAFRSLKTVDLNVRPIHHRTENRVRAHIFLCMLAYYVEWHMRRVLAPMLFDDDDKLGAAAKRRSIVAPAQRSDRALSKAASKTDAKGKPVHSFQTLLRDLATIAKNRMASTAIDDLEFEKVTRPTELQQQALNLLELSV